MRAMGKNPTEEELLNLVMEVDGDHNGTIEFSEFLDLMRHNSLAIDEEADLKAAFKMFDSNGNYSSVETFNLCKIYKSDTKLFQEMDTLI